MSKEGKEVQREAFARDSPRWHPRDTHHTKLRSSGWHVDCHVTWGQHQVKTSLLSPISHMGTLEQVQPGVSMSPWISQRGIFPRASSSRGRLQDLVGLLL